MRRLLCAVAALLAAQAWAQSDAFPRMDALAVESFRYQLMPPERLLDSKVVRVLPSPEGRFALAVQEDESAIQSAARSGRPAPAPSRVWILDASTRKSVSLPETLAPGAHLRLAWTSSPGVALVLVGGQTSHKVYRMDGERGLWRLILESPASESGLFPDIYPSPVDARFVLLGQVVEFDEQGAVAREEWRVQVRDLEGRRLQTQAYPRETSGPAGHIWLSGGQALALKVKANRTQASTLAVLNLATMELDRIPDTSEPPAPGLFAAALARTAETNDRAAWLESGSQRALVSGSATLVELAANLGRVFFVSNGVLFSRTIQRLEASRYEEARIAFLQDTATRMGREIARAMALYNRDNPSGLPESSRLKESLKPYTPDDDALAAFTPTYPGGALPPTARPGSVELGYIDAGIGRAVIFLDGSVSWRFSPRGSGSSR